jgi:outer membrane protein TolC
VLLLATSISPAFCEGLPDALVRTYQGSPQLNAERARQRGTDENVPQALSGYRPQIIASLSSGLQAVRVLLPDNTVQTATLKSWTIGVTVTQTIFNGFKTANSVRQSEAQVFSNQTQTAAIAAWVTHEGAKIALAATEAEVRAANVALSGVQKEAQGGQRTTLDVLNSQADLNAARARLIGAQRDRAIAAYTLLSASGRLDVKSLALNTPDYSPDPHYHQVRDAWGGLRTPAGQ